MVMGCYGIGVTRLLGAAIEQGHDEKGIIWPISMAPFEVVICPMGYEKSEVVKAACDQLHDELLAAGIDVILDDRNERPGAMFADWELIGAPFRVVIGDRGLADSQVEFKGRTDAESQNIPLTQIKDKVIAAVQAAKNSVA
jgi:prolyl-tRNA synthetase